MHVPAFFRISVRSIVFACSLVLVLALAACGSSTSTTGSTPTPTSQAASSPTVASSPTTSTSAAMTTYNGNGYSIDYPQGWKVNAAGKSVVFADSSGVY